MKDSLLFFFKSLSMITGTAFLLTSCAPATTGLAPSGALKDQLAEIRQQQQQQTQTIQQLQQQLALLQQQLGTETAPPTQTQTQSPVEPPGLEATAPAGETATIMKPQPQFSVSQEVSTVAASASSYLAAFSDLAAGRWLAAETGFQKFLNEFSDHPYAPNARYWLASAQLSQGKVELAMSNLRQIIVDPNGQKKAPAALILLAQSYRQQGLSIEADDVLEQLRNRYPDSSEAQQIYRSNEPLN